MKKITIIAAVLAATSLTLISCTKEEPAPVPGQDLTEARDTIAVADTAYIMFRANTALYSSALVRAEEQLLWDGSYSTSVDIVPGKELSVSLHPCVVAVMPGSYTNVRICVLGKTRRYGDRIVRDNAVRTFPSVTAAAGEVVDLGIIE